MLVNRLAHVVNGEQPGADRGERLHLDPGAADGLRGDGALDRMGGGVERELGRDPGERDRVAQRDQLAGSLRGLDRGDARDADHVALLRMSAGDHLEGRRLHQDAAGGDRHPAGLGLGADVDHVGLAGGIEMGK